ncbi:hypothetical protein [Amycolatopsis sp. YIM 10]|nr:hypothetical protein [Amycolatopsis sp. YIM 10]QFU86778.1 hypothetical protein YIM_07835 [Amycolatopsis sp. YIM 10]
MLAKVYAGSGDHGMAIKHGESSACRRHRIGDFDGEAYALTPLAQA